MNFDEIMEYNEPYNKNNLNELIDKIRTAKVVPFVGAGLSMLFDGVYPSWNDFLNLTYREYIKDYDIEKFNELSFEDRADFLYNNIGKMTFSEHLKKVFGDRHIDVDSSKFADKAVFLLPSIFTKGLLITTNYDKVIEKNYAVYEKNITVAHPGHFEALTEALRKDELLLYKIHGDISEPIESIILTKEQYEKAYDNKELENALRQIFVSKDMLFLGCSLIKDRYLDSLCNVSTSGMTNYAILPCEELNVKERRIELENKYFTKGIIYPAGKHECVYDILKYIADEVNPQGCATKKKSAIRINDDWFVNQNIVQVKNLGDRYLPDLNIELDVSRVFDALSRNTKFYDYFMKKSDDVLIQLNKLKFDEIQKYIIEISDVIEKFKSSNNNEQLDVLHIEEIAERIFAELETKKRMYLEELQKNKNSVTDNNLYSVDVAYRSLENYIEYINSNEIQVLNNSFVLLYGEGGIGKSHLLADIINQRVSQGKKSLFFLGQHFKKNNPISEMLSILDLSCGFEELLEQLNFIGETEKSKIILFIDALNEGNGKNIWNEHLAGIVERIKKYSWIGLVVSVRTEYVDSLFEDKSLLRESFAFVKHNGFSTIEHSAVKKYFDVYGITCMDIPLSEPEFKNPLFLRLFCEGFKGKTVDLSEINFTDIYKNFLRAINRKIAIKCNYSNRINIVEKVIDRIVEYKYNHNLKNNFVPLNDAVELIVGIEKTYNINNSLLDELISNGILTQNIRYDNDEYIYVTYERLEDYLYAKKLVDDLNEMGKKSFEEKHSDLIYYGDVLEALAIVLPESSKYELFEIFEPNSGNIIKSFSRSLKWRKKTRLEDKVFKYINNTILKSADGFETFFEELIFISAKIGHDLNAERTVNYILSFTMPERDSLFIPLLDQIYYEEGSAINRLLEWCFMQTDETNALEETIRLVACMLATFLITSNNLLRDKTTKALVCLLSGRIDVLLAVMDKFKDVDDPYIIERLYAVCFGCVVNETSELQIEKLALFVYNRIFNCENVYPNILIRDYAKNIVNYAKYKVDSEELKTLDVQPPYKSSMPKIPSDEEIKKYELDYRSSDFKDYYWSQNAIISSMQVEYNRKGQPGGYGDFGRYTFQSYFSNWDGMDYNDLKNIAIKRIFELGYDVERHGEYDRHIGGGRHRSLSRERIGKKYQWIALYELAAQVADNYDLKVYTGEYGEKKKMKCLGTFEPYIRNIDPTIKIIASQSSNINKIHSSIYSLPQIDHMSWLANFNDLPDVEKLIKMTYQNNDYLLLNGWYSWEEEKPLGVQAYQTPQKNIWIQINGYIVKEEHHKKFINIFESSMIDLMGRWAAEPNENSQLYNKEYYWSDGFEFFKDPYYCGNEWKEFDSHYSEYSKLFGEEKVLIPVHKYFSERYGDNFKSDMGNAASVVYKPCVEIFDSLSLQYGKGNSCLYDSDGELVCFDSNEIFNEDIGFFMKESSLKQFLKSKGYSMFWTILSEKRILHDSVLDREINYPMPHISGFFYFGDSGEMVYKVNNFK